MRFILIATSVLCMTFASPQAIAQSDVPSVDKAKWAIVWSDEFDGTEMTAASIKMAIQNPWRLTLYGSMNVLQILKTA